MSGVIARECELEIVNFVLVSHERAHIGMRERGGGRLCALYCDPWSALGIQQAHQGFIPPVLHAQGLHRRLIQDCGATLTKVLLFDGSGDSLHARLFLTQDGREFVVDCRAADGVSQAIRWKLPILIDELALQRTNERARRVPADDAPPAGNA